MEELTIELSQYGDVLAIKNDYVFTLLMKVTDCQAKKVFNIVDLAASKVPDKEKIELMKNDDEFLLLILKP